MAPMVTLLLHVRSTLKILAITLLRTTNNIYIFIAIALGIWDLIGSVPDH